MEWQRPEAEMCLAGVIGSLLAQGNESRGSSTSWGVCARAGGRCRKRKMWSPGMMASDIIEGLKEVEKS